MMGVWHNLRQKYVLNKFMYFIGVCFLKLKSAVLFSYTVKCTGFEKSKVRPGPSLMRPGRILMARQEPRWGVALAETGASPEAEGLGSVRRGNSAASVSPGLGLPSTLFCLPHPFVMYAVFIRCGLFQKSP